MPLSVRYDRRNKGDFIFRTATNLAAPAFSTKVIVVGLDALRQDGGFLALAHRLHEFVLEPPAGAVARPEKALEFQSRSAVFALGQDVHGLEPCHQAELTAVEDHSGPHGRLSMVAITLERHDPAVPDHTMVRIVAGRTDEPVRPARFFQGRFA